MANRWVGRVLVALALLVSLPAHAVVTTTSMVSGPYACSGDAATLYNVTFPFLDRLHLTVTAGSTVLAYGTDYTASSPGVSGSVLLTNAGAAKCAVGLTLTIGRVVPLTQGTAFAQQGKFSPPALELSIDKLTMGLQQESSGWRDAVSKLNGFLEAVPPVVWSFAGDGASATFALAGANIATTASYVVTLDGVVQKPVTDYAVDVLADTITFATAPPDGAVGVVRLLGYVQALSDHLVTATGSSAARALADRFSDTRNVQDFGAATSATASDNGSAFQAAAASGGVVRVPPGTFAFTSFTLPAGSTLEGAGQDVTFLDTATSGVGVTVGGDRVAIRNLTIRQTSGVKQGKGLAGSHTFKLTTESVRVTGFQYNLYFDKSQEHVHKQLLAENGTFGTYYWGAAGVWNTDWFNNILTFDTCRFSGNDSIGLYAKGEGVTLINPDLSGQITLGAIGLKVTGEPSTGYTAHAVKIVSPYVENTQIPFSFVNASVEIDGGYAQGGGVDVTPNGTSAGRMTSIIDADASTVFVRGKLGDRDYWQSGHRVTNGATLVYERPFSGSVRVGNTVDGTSKVLLPDYDEGSFTGTLVGGATSPTVTVQYVRSGKAVTLFVPAMNAASNATTLWMSGIPAAITPATTQGGVGYGFDNDLEAVTPYAVGSNGLLAFYKTAYGGEFTASGLKGWRTLAITYSLY